MSTTALTDDNSAMKEAFESAYGRDWNDPASDDMKAVWAKAWTACQRVYFGGTPITPVL